MSRRTSWQECQKLEYKASSVINTSWHYDWYWDRDGAGHLTNQGWRDVSKDLLRRLADTRKELTELMKLAHRLRPILDQIGDEEREFAAIDAELKGEER